MNLEPKTAEELAEMADRGEDVTAYMKPLEKGFLAPKNAEKMRETKRVNVDFGVEMLDVLDEYTKFVNGSRQGVIKGFVEECLRSRGRWLNKN